MTDSRFLVFQALEADSYARASRFVHQKDSAIYLSLAQSKGLTLAALESARNVTVFRVLTFKAAILTEVDGASAIPGGLRDLGTAWKVLQKNFDPATEVYRLRCRGLVR